MNGLKNDWIFDLLIDQSDRIWCGSPAGYSVIDLDEGSYQHLSPMLDSTGISELNYVYKFHEQPNGMIWAYTSENNWITFDLTSLEPKATTLKNTAIFYDKDAIWTNASNGISRYDLNERSTKHYTIEDGVPKNTTIQHMVRDDQGLYWLATGNGIWSWE